MSDESSQAGGTRRSWISLCVVMAGAFMAILDVAIVNVAMPSVQEDLHAGFGAVELVVTAYTLLYASFLVTGGRLGDLLGRRRMFLIGLSVFTGASALCGAAPDVHVLIGARALQGLGAAMLYPQVLAIIQIAFPGKERGRALGVFGGVVGVGAIAGQIIGGLLLAWNPLDLGWRPTFLVNVPIGVLTIIATWLVLPADTPQEDSSHLDWGGSALSAITLAMFTVPLLTGRTEGWPVWMLVSLAAVVPAGFWLLRHERRVADRGRTPLIRAELFRNRGFARGVPIAAMFSFSYVGFMILLAIYLQTGLHFTPLHAAMVYTPDAIGFLASSLLAARLTPLLGRHVLTLGYSVAALGLLATAATAAAADTGLSGWELAPPLLVAGLGQGLGMTPLIGTIISTLSPAQAGAGAGVVTTTLQVGNATGVAVQSLVFFSVLGPGGTPHDYASAFSRVLPLAALAVLGAAFMVTRLPRNEGARAGNALLGPVSGHTTGVAYSLFLMTGGRVGDRQFQDVLGKVTEERLHQDQEAPEGLGSYWVHNFRVAHQDAPWISYLAREALAYGDRRVPHESDRAGVLDARIAEIRERQRRGSLPDRLDADLLGLLSFALANYPRLLPQITRMTTGLSPRDPRFEERWEEFLRQLGDLLEPASAPHMGDRL
ncbi:MFS transporter [Streptomyces cocklensis]|uniref:MFS domain-containing protein n=1 Tax=Actinacidiphila cocklensis TaxID=887465 RepID=A0A9W4DVD2_9ACTN|nr:MFS transporter [Actinacidiphila cocklensis]MDD1060737.1 MFS transporter [Actinacidiphila cocklensis]WSX73742.1 MFS transporter [Streptomyces sp. NBC_00899]WSX80195.1 MFS transporter [Streptomyces sp. NBC_00899]CAG6394602.1 MFS domain-containing protein [Actinacidiphila cocklensis]